jgi:hypothetical protein
VLKAVDQRQQPPVSASLQLFIPFPRKGLKQPDNRVAQERHLSNLFTAKVISRVRRKQDNDGPILRTTTAD